MTDSVKTVAETAERLGVTIVTVKRWAADGQLTAIRESPFLFAEAEVERKVAELITELEGRLAHLRRETVEAV